MSRGYQTSSNAENQLSCLPYGSGHNSEGVCLLVKMGPHRILLDCGLEDISALQTTNPPAELILCTHAHKDHVQGIWDLHQTFPHIPIYASEVTVKLLPLNWPSLSPQEIGNFCQGLPWYSPIEFGDNLVARLFPAGHLPGAAAVALTYTSYQRSYTLLYTGDFFLSNSQLVEGLSIEALRDLSPDVLIIEGTYGTARHPHRRQQEKKLMERINQALTQNKSVLMPVPPLGLGQEILKLLRSHHQFTGRDLDIWVDSNVARGCDYYLNILPELPASVQNFAKHQPLFWDERVRPRMRRLDDLKQTIQLEQKPCLLLTDISSHWQDYDCLEENSWLILLPKYLEHSQDHKIHQKLSVENYLLAQHSDRQGTTQLIHNLRPQHVVFIHGFPAYLEDLTSLEELQNRYHLHSPLTGTLVELPIGEKFIQPAPPPETYYEGQLSELETGVNVILPHSISGDSRWHNFGDTGLIEARWQGEELVLRGLSQRELLSQSNDARILADTDCCGNCCYQKGQRCWNQASPLYGFKVTPDGYCPVFESEEP